jgi:coenzyme F420-reducing hydrogenase delta subunit
MMNLSSAEGARFAELCEEMTQAVKALGPSPLRRARGEVELEEAAHAQV